MFSGIARGAPTCYFPPGRLRHIAGTTGAATGAGSTTSRLGEGIEVAGSEATQAGNAGVNHPARRMKLQFPYRLGATFGKAMALSTIAFAVATGPAIAAQGIAIELNKLEQTEKGCRVYVVVNNSGEAAYQAYKLDLVLFQPDGVIGKRLALDLAPIRAAKRTVKLFDFDAVPCDRIGSLLVNDMLDCRTDAGAQSDCLAGLTLSSLTSVKLSK